MPNKIQQFFVKTSSTGNQLVAEAEPRKKIQLRASQYMKKFQFKVTVPTFSIKNSLKISIGESLSPVNHASEEEEHQCKLGLVEQIELAAYQPLTSVGQQCVLQEAVPAVGAEEQSLVEARRQMEGQTVEGRSQVVRELAAWSSH